MINDYYRWTLPFVVLGKKSREINSNGAVGHFLIPILPQDLFGVLIDKQISQAEIKLITSCSNCCKYADSLKHSQMSTILFTVW